MMETMHIRCAGFSAAVDAYARDEAELWFVSLLGNQQSVRAIWARLLKGEPAVLSDDALIGGRYCELAREARGATRFHAAKLPITGATHGMLIPEHALYASERFDFLLLARSEAEAPALHYRFLNRRVELPFHPLWADWLWERALATGEARPLHALGVQAWHCVPDRSELKQALGGALRAHRVPLPAGASEHTAL